MGGHNRAVFIDRDGVLVHRVANRSQVEAGDILAGVPEGLGKIREIGYCVFLVCNQPQVAHGLMTEGAMEDLHGRLLGLIGEQNMMAFIDGVYVSMNHPEASMEAYREDSECRLPRPGLLMRASGDFSVDLSRSVMVGDNESSVLAGHLAGCRAVMVGPGETVESGLYAHVDVDSELRKPDHIASDLQEVGAWLESLDLKP